MKRLVLALLFLLNLATVAQGKIFKAYNGNVYFDHSKHMGMFECKNCHDGPPRPFPVMNKAVAHKLCIGCHKEQGTGPVRHCSECHTGREEN